MRPHMLAVVLILATLTACGGAEESRNDAHAELKVERVQENGLTVVRNLAGSEWGGPAELVPELQIGVMEGDPDYMHGSPSAFWVEDEEIYVVDGQDSEVRVYGLREGDFRRRFGRPGQGPGEFEGTTGILADGDRVLVSSRNKIVVFDRAGHHLDDWTLTGYQGWTGLVATPDGLYRGIMIPPENPGPGLFGRDMTWGYARLGPDGYSEEPRLVPEMEFDPPTMTVDFGGGRIAQVTIPGHPSGVVHDLMPTGDLVYGYPDRYRFHVERSDGTTFAIERVIDPVEFHPDELDYIRRQTVQMRRRQNPDYDWDGARMPDVRPSYFRFLADQGGNVWVAREGAAERVEDCTEPEDIEPGQPWVGCWQPRRVLDVFSLEDGRYLGEVIRPDNTTITGWIYVRGTMVVGGTQDEMGTPLVTVFRVVRPSDREET